jgi:uncharacterized repeat protein (TIGR01451 family)
MTNYIDGTPDVEERKPPGKTKRTAAALGALAVFMHHASPALAAITNDATATGTGPNGPVNATDSESVDVVDYAPQIALTKTWTFVPGPTGDVNGNGLVDAGDRVRFTYVVTNTGNVTLANVVTDDTLFQGTGTTPTIVLPTTYTDNGPTGGSSDPVTGDGDWDELGPQDSITLTSEYTVVAGDLSIGGNTDNDLDTTGRARGNYDPPGPTGNVLVTATDPEPVPLNVVPGLNIAKVADDTTNVTVGQVITYTYTVSNTGNVPLTGVTVADNITAGSGPDPTPVFSSWTTQAGSTVTGNTLTLFNPGAVAVFTGTYTVTQSDVDNLQ